MTTKPADHLPGHLFVVSGPSGVGKTVLCSQMIERLAPDVVYSISATTRAPRGSEKDGVEYFFYTVDQFREAISQDRLAEWALVHGNYYGTPKSFLEEQRGLGKHVLLNIDVQGGMKIRGAYPEAVLVFIQPPSLAILEERIRKRNTDTDATVRHRMENARSEMAFLPEYSYSVVNDDLAAAADDLERLIRKHITTGS